MLPDDSPIFPCSVLSPIAISNLSFLSANNPALSFLDKMK